MELERSSVLTDYGGSLRRLKDEDVEATVERGHRAQAELDARVVARREQEECAICRDDEGVDVRVLASTVWRCDCRTWLCQTCVGKVKAIGGPCCTCGGPPSTDDQSCQ